MTARPPFRRNKYRVAPAEQRRYKGRTYASKAERDYAALLDLELASGNYREWVPQPIVTLVEGYDVRPDFLIIDDEGGAFYVDVKGMETTAFKKTKRMWSTHGRLPLRVVKRKGARFVVTEIIAPGE